MKQYPLPRSPIFLASCGCIGLDIGGEQWTAINRCDADHEDDQPSLDVDCRSYDPDKTYEPLSLEATKAILENLACLVGGGHRMDQVRHIMGGKRVPLPYRVKVLSPVDADGHVDYSRHYVKVEKNQEGGQA